MLAPLIEAAFYLNFEEMKKITNVTLQVPLYCGTSEEDI
jgi:hypothetical protein